jgi:hypothetical protein
MLTDALLLDPWRDSYEVWIWARTDQPGSGMQADPFSGRNCYTPPVSIALNWNASTPYVVQVTALQPVDQAPYSYMVGDLITISAATDPQQAGALRRAGRERG